MICEICENRFGQFLRSDLHEICFKGSIGYQDLLKKDRNFKSDKEGICKKCKEEEIIEISVSFEYVSDNFYLYDLGTDFIEVIE